MGNGLRAGLIRAGVLACAWTLIAGCSSSSGGASGTTDNTDGDEDSAPSYLIVANVTSDTIHSYSIDPESGSLTEAGEVAGGDYPYVGEAHPTLPVVYVLAADDDTIGSYSVDPESGELAAIGSMHATGTEADGTAIRPDGKFLYATDLGAGNLYIFEIDQDDGTLGAADIVDDVVPSDVTDVAADASSGALYVGANSEGEASVTSFPVDAEDGGLGSEADNEESGTDSPIFAITPGADFLYSLDGSNDIHGWSLDGEGGMTSLGAPTDSGLTETIHVATSPNGERLYVLSNNGDGVQQIAAFQIGSGGGLTPSGDALDIGGDPAWVVVDPNSKFVYVANGSAGSVNGFEIDQDTGELEPLAGFPLAVVEGGDGIGTVLAIQIAQ